MRQMPRAAINGEAAVTSYLGEGAYGPTYAASVSLPCNVDSSRRLVRNPSGDEVVSETTVRLDHDAGGVDVAAVFVPESLVTVQGRQASVIECKPHLGRSAEVVYVEVVLT